jgi:hypothetical protein
MAKALRLSGLPPSAAGANGAYEPRPGGGAGGARALYVQVAPEGQGNFLCAGSCDARHCSAMLPALLPQPPGAHACRLMGSRTRLHKNLHTRLGGTHYPAELARAGTTMGRPGRWGR